MKNIIFIFLILGVLGCAKELEKIRDTQAISINLKHAYIADSSIIRSISYIPLETNPNCLIGSIDKILFFKNEFYLFDASITKTLFVFDCYGNFVRKYSNLGKGPGEFIEPMDFNIDSMGNAYILDNGSMKIIKYNNTGNFREEYHLNIRFTEFYVVDDDQLIVHNVFSDFKEKVNLGIYNNKSKKLTVIRKSREVYDDNEIPRFHVYSLNGNNNNVFFSPRYSNTVFSVNLENNSLDTSIIIEDLKPPPTDYLLRFKDDVRTLLIDGNYLMDVSGVYVSSGKLLLSYLKQGNWKILKDLKTGNYVNFLMFDEDKYIGDQRIHGIANDRFISILDINHFPPDFIKKKIETLFIADSTKIMLKNLKPNSNPVIVLIDFIDF